MRFDHAARNRIAARSQTLTPRGRPNGNPAQYKVRVIGLKSNAAFLGKCERAPVLRALAVSIAYFLGAELGFALTPQPNPVSTLWPPNAMLLGALLLAPKRSWPLLIAAVFPAHLLSGEHAEDPFERLP